MTTAPLTDFRFSHHCTVKNGIVQPNHAPTPATNHTKCSSLPPNTLSCNGCNVMTNTGVQIRLVMMDSASVALRTM